MHATVKISAVLAALAVLGGSAAAQTPTPAPPPVHRGLFSKLFHRPAVGTGSMGTGAPGGLRGRSAMNGMTPLSGGIVGNKKSHVYHLPGDKGALPAPQNRVYFHSAAEAQAAGYHAAGSHSAGRIAPRMARPAMHPTLTH